MDISSFSYKRRACLIFEYGVHHFQLSGSIIKR